MKLNTKQQQQQWSPYLKKILPWAMFSLLPLALFRIYFYPLTNIDDDHHPIKPIITTIATFPSPSPKEKERVVIDECEYGNGKWVPDKRGPLYNGTSCGTIKDGQNCMSHGRPDTDYLYWRWKPNQDQCQIPRFDSLHFLSLHINKHLAFVGDSMARNQMESLLCMLSSYSTPNLIYSNGDDNKFRRWNFPSHNFTISIYWSPFLVKGIEKTESRNYNRLFLESVDEKWASDLDQIDTIILSVGHWFLHRAVYSYDGSVLGCHSCEGMNFTEIGFYDVFGKAIKTSIDAIIERQSKTRSYRSGFFDVIVTTFSPHHFEGEWDKLGACSKTMPFEEWEKKLEGMDFEMRESEMKEIRVGKMKIEEFGGSGKVRLEGVDVTKMALLRPDGHPGPYLYPNPFKDGVKERVQNDCVHWCMPGPIDTWNEILFEVIKRWQE
ncbi:xyloglucan O-acetyltransferase 1 [Impatiens glandulifera]|uniref:xyloglucan O-acetyltransferase 1 n=1 Tax=Impatiens glandulifera TaxID=253017 RepID=UPI001FB0AC46|nr:xyloglucan O-acetyltransferase 1 [Impatiens glandulifera]